MLASGPRHCLTCAYSQLILPPAKWTRGQGTAYWASCSSGVDLADEPLRADGRRQFGMQYLEGDQAIVLEVARKVDRGHSPELALEHVAVPQVGL
jgi:hypothetical protein